ncbi:MAG: hypothetical protein PQJ46_09415 [Spirochaetales bacterium]|nr:hypothetical protein [Spirochaetales bacterium]
MIDKGDFDNLFDSIVSILEAYSDEQDSDYQFKVKPDYYRNLPASSSGAYAFPYFNELSAGQKAGHVGYIQFSAQYIIDLFVFAKATDSSRADKAAGSRLRYLIQQVLDAIYNNENSQAMRRLGKPSFSPVPPERMNQMGERAYAACRMSFSANTAFEPSELEGTNLEAISITADELWSAYIEPEQREDE